MIQVCLGEIVTGTVYMGLMEGANGMRKDVFGTYRKYFFKNSEKSARDEEAGYQLQSIKPTSLSDSGQSLSVVSVKGNLITFLLNE